MIIRSKMIIPYLIIVSMGWIGVLTMLDCIGGALCMGAVFLYLTVQWVFPELRTIIMDKEGCTVTWLIWKKTHQWKDLAIIREDTWGRGRIGFKGVVFSKKAIGKKGKIYTTTEIFNSLDFFNCFYVIFDGISETEFLSQMEEWGVKVEKGEELKKEEQYKEMVEMRKRARERQKSALKKDNRKKKK